MKVKKLTSRDINFPGKLRQLHKPPRQLFIKGVLADNHSVAIVGARGCSKYGKHLAFELGQRLAGWGINVISGLALGIDGYAHHGALQSGITTAVLAGSVEDVYPASHRRLAQEILSTGGALLSEHPTGYEIRRYSFIERNRIISALSDAVVVVEAAERSGSLTTAQFALELGKPVLAVPGRIDQLTSHGTNRLIAAGARPLIDAVDILDELNLAIPKAESSVPLGLTHEEQMIIDLLAKEPHQINELGTACRMETQRLSSLLTKMELRGAVDCQGGGYWRLKRKA